MAIGSEDGKAHCVALASEGPYRTDHHLATGQGWANAELGPNEFAKTPARRLKAVRRVGIVDACDRRDMEGARRPSRAWPSEDRRDGAWWRGVVGGGHQRGILI